MMWDCGRDGNFWGNYALGCLPDEVLTQCGDRLAFVSTTESDGRRLTQRFCEGRDIVVLSERIVPKGHRSEADAQVRYFVFAVLHEVAHAYCDHRPPNEISKDENDAQEAEANALAFQWFNDFIGQENRPALPEFTQQELERAQAANREAMLDALGRR